MSAQVHLTRGGSPELLLLLVVKEGGHKVLNSSFGDPGVILEKPGVEVFGIKYKGRDGFVTTS